MWSRVGPSNYAVFGVQMPTREGEKLPAQDMPGGGYTQSDSAGDSTGTVWMPTEVYYMGVQIGANWLIRLNHPCATAMRPYVKLL